MQVSSATVRDFSEVAATTSSSSSSSSSTFGSSQPSGDLTIQFGEGSNAKYRTYSKALLHGFAYFCDHEQGARERLTQFCKKEKDFFEFSSSSGITYALFDTAVQLFLEKKQVHEVVTLDQCTQSPDTVEMCAKMVAFLHPGPESDAFILEFKKRIDRWMTLDIAEAIFQSHLQKKKVASQQLDSTAPSTKTSSSSSSEKYDEPEPLPFILAIAKKKIIQSRMYKNPADLAEKLQAIQSTEAEKELQQSLLKMVQAQLVRLTPNSFSYKNCLMSKAKYEKAIERHEKAIASLEGEIPQDVIHFTDCPMKNKMYLSECVETEFPFLVVAAQAAKQQLESYRADVVAALTHCGADMTRDDLLASIIGPRSFILDEAGITLCRKMKRPDAPPVFKNPQGVTVRFNLLNTSIQSFRQEVTSSGAKDTLKLQTQNEHLMTKKVRQEMPALRALFEKWRDIAGHAECLASDLRHYGGYWQVVSKFGNPEKHDQAKKQLIKFFGWDKHGITSNDIVIYTEMSSKRPLTSMQLVFRQTERVITLDVDDFTLIHTGSNQNPHARVKMPSIDVLLADTGTYTRPAPLADEHYEYDSGAYDNRDYDRYG